MPPWSTVAPEPRSRLENWPTLLFSWWCTGFAAVIILVRLNGRKTRSNVLFREDWLIMAALIPLFVRMAFIHVVLQYGTNNIQTVGHTFTSKQLEHRSVGARLVLCARIFYAMFIWTSKLTVSEFLKRITVRTWRKSYELTLQGIRVFLFVTFFAVVIATLAECHPFDHYWQIIPDPGPQCRLGYAHLFTMGICDIITDILLIAFPIPIVIRSGQNWRRKTQLAILFSLSAIMIAVTATRIPMVIAKDGRQQYRTVWASCEILASTAVSNGIIIGSFLRDKGTKKNKYRSQSVTDSIDGASGRRPTVVALQQCGSDEDLFRAIGCRVPDHLRDEPDAIVRPAPAALPAKPTKRRDGRSHSETPRHEMQQQPTRILKDSDESLQSQTNRAGSLPSPAPSTKRSVSFFDVGGLLDDGAPSWDTRSRSTTLVSSEASGTMAQDFAPTPEQSRRGSRALVQDIGGVLSPTASRNGTITNGFHRRHSHAQQTLQRHRQGHTVRMRPHMARSPTEQSLQDVGGLLSEGHEPDASAASLERAAEGQQERPYTGTAPRPRRHRADELTLHDPGGLLS
ncbi:hypothetical protein BAUCODRAFT_99708 [Baudoinia panamericana UAMH 10762]|uniref:Rhodopsin domain-containing protein n=1 Tax=Baudoinia panamericana (strain UAMH 10762) TaxID=717646 RepID=M2MU66_BAUPA|nr:uncharacterized protein BAUCODRAFT_99708 [Baudoinia panamericana UAMH 10762]EMD00467.1 hypothetical protein BAUCODRAFT_99708 [Baudoinia panamericana UAMH 10762]